MLDAWPHRVALLLQSLFVLRAVSVSLDSLSMACFCFCQPDTCTSVDEDHVRKADGEVDNVLTLIVMNGENSWCGFVYVCVFVCKYEIV